MMADLTMENPLATQPQLNKIAEDTIDCIAELKKEFVETKLPVNDDNQILHRFCAKLEHLLRAEMKEKTTLLGRRKDYWDFFCDCLSSTKGLNDGIKFVKSTGEYKTSLGRGRAFLRFSLVHQRLADTLQQCVMNGRVASDWYTTKSVWLQHDQKAELIAALYDLTEVNFDLSPRGYDLDNAWPSFSRKAGGGTAPYGNWNPPSRASSYTSIVSIPGHESVYTGRERRDTTSSAVSEAEYDQLQKELSQVEGENSNLSMRVEELEREKNEVSESVVNKERTLSDLDRQLNQAQDRCGLLETEMGLKEKSWTEKEELLKQTFAEKLKIAEERMEQLKMDIGEKESSFVLMEDSYKAQVQEMETENQRLCLEVKSIRQDADHASAQVTMHTETIANLQSKLDTLEGKNRELLDKMETMIFAKDGEATSQLDTAGRLHEVLEELKTSERVNVEIQSKLEESARKIQTLEAALEEKMQMLDNNLKQQEQTLVELSQLEAKFNELEQRKNKESENLQTTLSRLDENKMESEQLSGNLKELEAQMKEKDLMIEKLSAGLQQIKEQHEILLKSTDQQHQRGTELEHTLDAAENLNLELKAEVDKLKSSVQERESELRNEQSEHIKRLDELMNDIKELQECKDRLGEQVQRSGVDKDRLEQELENVRGKLRDSIGAEAEVREQEDCLKSLIYSLRAAQAGEEQTEAISKKTILLKDENIRSSIESFQSLYKRQQNQTVDLQSKNLQLQNDLSTQSQESSDKERQLQSLQLEMENLKAMNTALQSSEADVNSKMREDAAQIKLKNDRIIDLESDTKVKVEKICQLENEVRIKCEEVASKNEQIMEMSTSVQVTQAELQRSSRSREELDKDLLDHRNKHSALEQNLQSASQQIMALIAEKKELVNKLEISETHVTELQNAKKNLVENIHDLKQSHLSEKEQFSNTMKQEIAELKQEVSSEKSEKNAALGKVLDLEQHVGILTRSLAESECKNISDQKTSTEKLEAVTLELNALLAEKTKSDRTLREFGLEIDSLKSENSEFDQKKSEADKSLTELGAETQSLKTENSELTQQKNESERVLAELSEEMQSLKTENIELTKKNAERDKILSELGDEVQSLKTENTGLAQEKSERGKILSELNVEIESLKTENLRLNQEIVNLKTAHGENINLLEFEKVQTQKRREEINESRTEQENLQSKIAAIEVEKNTLSDKLENVLKDTVDSNQLHEMAVEERLSEVQKLTESVEALTLALDNEKEAAVLLREEREALQGQLEGLKQDLAGLREEQSSTLKSVEERENALTVANRQLDGDRQAFVNQIEVQEQEIQSLKFQLSSQQLIHEQALTSYTTQMTDIGQMTDRLGEQEQLIDQLEAEMNQIKQVREEEQKQQIAQLEDLRKSLKSREEEFQQLQSKLLQTTSDLQEEKDKIAILETRQAMVQNQSEDSLKRGQKECAVLRSDNAQLKKKLIKLIKEKDALWQKTDTLVFQQRVHAKEKWMEDNEVTNCLGCRIEFSFTIRKHHCRMCGRIFCWNCSNNWVLTTHSNKKARVCNGCHSHQNEVEGTTDSSLVGNDSEDEDDNPDESDVSQVKGADDSISQSSGGTTSPSMDLSGIMSGDTDSVTSTDVRTTNSSGPVTKTTTARDNQTDDHKTVRYTFPADLNNEFTSTTEELTSVSDTGGNSGGSASDKEDPFHVISEEEIEKSVSEALSSPPLSLDTSMTTSLTISVEELEKGHVNSNNEVWIKAGKRFAVPILIEATGVVLYWEFTTQPKDIGFSATYAESESTPPHEAHVLIEPCKCNSHRQTVKGELTAKKSGVYTLMFDNTYSKLTTKKLTYSLCVKRK